MNRYEEDRLVYLARECGYWQALVEEAPACDTYRQNLERRMADLAQLRKDIAGGVKE